MEISNPIIQDEREFRNYLSRLTATRTRFSIGLDPLELARRLWQLYRQEVVMLQGELDDDEELHERLKACAAWLADPKGKAGLMLMGGTGTGKTTMMHAVANMIEITARLEHVKNRDLYEATEVDAVDMATYACTPEGEKAHLRTLAGRRLLLIDDLGQEPSTVLQFGVERRPAEWLIGKRYSQRLMTIVTTNLPRHKWKDSDNVEHPGLLEHYGERTYDRLRELFHIVTFNRPSYRHY